MSEGPATEAVDWCRDHATSGWRSRAWLDKGEVIAYDDGRWEIRLTGLVTTSAQGIEQDAERAKGRALRVYEALTS